MVFALAKVHSQTSKNSPDIKWIELKATLESRISVIDNLVDLLSKSDKVDKDLITATKKNTSYLFQVIDPITEVDQEFIAYASKINDKATLAIAKTLASLENDPQFRKRNDVMELLTKLEGIENRLSVQKDNYNNLCKELGKPNLMFGSTIAEKSPQVKF
jgi:LemA protein